MSFSTDPDLFTCKDSAPTIIKIIIIIIRRRRRRRRRRRTITITVTITIITITPSLSYFEKIAVICQWFERMYLCGFVFGCLLQGPIRLKVL